MTGASAANASGCKGQRKEHLTGPACVASRGLQRLARHHKPARTLLRNETKAALPLRTRLERTNKSAENTAATIALRSAVRSVPNDALIESLQRRCCIYSTKLRSASYAALRQAVLRQQRSHSARASFGAFISGQHRTHRATVRKIDLSAALCTPAAIIRARFRPSDGRIRGCSTRSARYHNTRAFRAAAARRHRRNGLTSKRE